MNLIKLKELNMEKAIKTMTRITIGTIIAVVLAIAFSIYGITVLSWAVTKWIGG